MIGGALNRFHARAPVRRAADARHTCVGGAIADLIAHRARAVFAIVARHFSGHTTTANAFPVANLRSIVAQAIGRKRHARRAQAIPAPLDLAGGAATIAIRKVPVIAGFARVNLLVAANFIAVQKREPAGRAVLTVRVCVLLRDAPDDCDHRDGQRDPKQKKRSSGIHAFTLTTR